MIDETLVTFLGTALAGVTVIPAYLPQQTACPAIVYQRISATHEKTVDDARSATARFQFSCFGSTYPETVATADDLREALDNAEISGVISVLLESEVGPMYDYDAQKYRSDLDFMVVYPE